MNYMSLCIYMNEFLWISEQFVELPFNKLKENTVVEDEVGMASTSQNS